MAKTITERVAELPPEEKEKHSDLIQECLEREKQIKNAATKGKEASEKFKKSFQKLSTDIYLIKKRVEKLRDNLSYRINLYNPN